jgi:hypothetical protein
MLPRPGLCDGGQCAAGGTDRERHAGRARKWWILGECARNYSSLPVFASQLEIIEAVNVMKIQDALIGAVSTLLVTVLGGVLVYYATKEPDENKVEKLIYVLNQTATFTGGTQELAFSTLTVSNEGGVAAKRPTITVEFKSGEIRDLAITAQGGAREINRERSDKRIRLVFESLLPRETITVSILLSQPERPSIDIRSEASLAEDHSLSATSTEKTRSEKWNSISKIVIPIVSSLSILIWFWLTLRLRRRGVFDLFADRNDTGFLLLHHGLVNDACLVLGDAIRAGRGDLLTLSNYALCRALSGDFDQAEKLINSAKFRERTGHGLAVVLFNESLIYLQKDNEAVALSKLVEAIKFSPRNIRRYAQKSIHLDGVREKPGFREALMAGKDPIPSATQ